MERIRLIYGQIEAAKVHMLRDTVLDNRIALILLDNVVELIMNRELVNQFALDEYYKPTWEPALTRWKKSNLMPNYSEEEKEKAGKEFRYKTRVLSLRLNRISINDRIILDVCHSMRSETFHNEVLRHGILAQIVRLLYLTTLDLSEKLPVQSYILPHQGEKGDDHDFLEKYSLEHPYSLTSSEGRQKIVRTLAEGVEIDASDFALMLSKDLLARIDDVIGGLYYLNDSSDEKDIDRDLQFTQFWSAHGTELHKDRIAGEALKDAFKIWQEEGNAKYTFKVIDNWITQAKAISKFNDPAKALEQFWGIENSFGPFEDHVGEEVSHFDAYINSQI